MKSPILSVFLLFCLSLSAQSYTIFHENGKVGVKDEGGRVLIPARYDGVGWSNGEFSIVNNVTGFREGRLWGLINLSNQKVTKPVYESLIKAGNLIVVSKKDATSQKNFVGCITISGKTVIPFQYDGIDVKGARAIVYSKIGNQFKFGLIDLENKTLIPQQYQDISPAGTSRFAVRNFEGKTSLFSNDGQQVTPFDIDSLSKLNHNYSLFYQGKNVGLLDKDGLVKLPAKFRQIEVTPNQIRTKEADEWLFVTGDNRVVRTVKGDSVLPVGAGLLKVKTGNVTELTDKELRPIGAGPVTDIGKFSSFGRAIYQLRGLSGLMMTDGRIILPAIYHTVIPSKDFVVANHRQGTKDNWILFDSIGVRLVSRSYEKMLPLAPGLFSVRQRGFWGIVDRTGREVVACAYDSLLAAKGKLILVRFKGMNGIISINEEWVVPPKSTTLSLIDDKRYLEYNGQTTFLREINGNAIYFSSNRIELADEFLIEYLPSGNIWKIDMNGSIVDRKLVPESAVDEIFEESEGYRAIKRNGRYGFIDSRGRLRIANRYEAVKPFKEGFAAVRILGKWGFIGLHDNLSAQPVYDHVESYNRGFAIVRQKNLVGLIDKGGRLVLPVRYDQIKLLESKNFLIIQAGQQGLADGAGRILIHPRFDSVSDAGNGFVVTSKNGRSGIVNYNGVSTVPQIYDYIHYDRDTDLFMALKKSDWRVVQ